MKVGASGIRRMQGREVVQGHAGAFDRRLGMSTLLNGPETLLLGSQLSQGNRAPRRGCSLERLVPHGYESSDPLF